MNAEAVLWAAHLNFSPVHLALSFSLAVLLTLKNNRVRCCHISQEEELRSFQNVTFGLLEAQLHINECSSDCDWNPWDTYKGVSPIEFSGTYFKVHMHRIPLHVFVDSWCSVFPEWERSVKYTKRILCQGYPLSCSPDTLTFLLIMHG